MYNWHVFGRQQNDKSWFKSGVINGFENDVSRNGQHF